MTPLHGWAARGKRLIGKALFEYWNNMTVIAALRYDAITAPWLIDGPINGSIFRTYGGEVLAPTLRKGDILRRENDPPHLDNLCSHKTPAVGARLFFLAAYSPDPCVAKNSPHGPFSQRASPIERVFAKLKHLLRKTAERNKEAVWRRIGSLLDQFSPQECDNYLRISGYGSVQIHHALTPTPIGLGRSASRAANRIARTAA